MLKKFHLLSVLALPALWLAGCTYVEGAGPVVTQDRTVSGFSRIELQTEGTVHLTQADTETLTVEAEENLLDHLETEVHGDTLYIAWDEMDEWHRPTQPMNFYVSAKEIDGLIVDGSGDIQADDLSGTDMDLVVKGSGDIGIEEITGDTFNVAVDGSGDIHVDRLTGDTVDLTINGSGEIKLGALTADTLHSRIHGSGNCYVTGEAPTQTLAIAGSGDYVAGDLESQTVEVQITGSGDAHVWASEDLHITITGSGGVDYVGTPEVNRHITGSGSVHSIAADD